MIPNLNSTQKEAVLHHGSPLLVLAGAGTGKTRVLTERIIHLINSYLAAPHQILAVTFTNKAAGEMKHRVADRVGELAQNIWMGTFHGIATRILRRHPEIVGLKSDFTIIDADDSLRLIKQIAIDLGIDVKEFPPKNYQYQIERLKDKGLLPSDLSENSSINQKLPKFLALYEIYQNRLQTLNCADFGDLLLYNLKIFSQSPESLQYYQNKFEHILVDEYQDTNKAQYQWLLKLAGSGRNICAVGDDDQSIYSWRGAEIANILRFEEDFSGTKIIRLEENYRSTSNILKVAAHLIKNNQHRHSKTLWTKGEDGSQVKLLEFLSDRMESQGIADIIFDLQKNDKINLNHIAILVRAGYQTRVFEEMFLSLGLPYRIIGGLKFYDRKEIRDAISYLRVVQNFDDDLALLRIINLPKRGMGEAGLGKLVQKAAAEKCSLFSSIKRAIADGELKGKNKQVLEELINNFSEWQSKIGTISVDELAHQVLEKSGYIAMWQSDKTPESAGRLENLEEFIRGLAEFESLSQFLEYVSLISGDEKIDSSKEMVNIMTVHSAKGLEFDCVFVPGLEDGVFPSARSVNERNGMEEERRLLYVAITRAKKNLYLSSAQNRFIFGQVQPTIISPFVKELLPVIVGSRQVAVSEEAVEKEENLLGKRVFHQKFGYGKVLEIEGEKLKISFEKGDVKMVMKNFVS